ncbi:MAG: hypothetical protein IT353_12945 [Gemmatimonadaceae bacterium]|nr:hypothetical protein [Gemmatimonadaceae bacterium]
MMTIGAVLPPALTAQDTTTSPRSRVCFRGRAKPVCDRFYVTEIGYYVPIISTSGIYDSTAVDNDTFGPPISLAGQRYRDASSQLTMQLGAMANVGRTSALGGVVLLGFGASGANRGLVVRYRRWLSADNVALDLSAGVVRGRMEGSRSAVTPRGMTAEVALNAEDRGALVLRGDMLRDDRGRTSSALLGGVRLGSQPAVGLVLGSILFLVLLFPAT